MATSGLSGGPDLLPMLSVMGKVKGASSLAIFFRKALVNKGNLQFI